MKPHWKLTFNFHQSISMVSASSNIYISATAAYKPEEQRDELRSQVKWLISVEPHNRVIPFMPKHKIERTHFTGEKSDADASYTFATFTATDGIIGTILVADAANWTAKDIGKALESDLRSSTDPTSSDEDHDKWIRKALHVLQEHKILTTFNVGEFLDFAHGYVADRASKKEGPAMIAYPGLHKDHKKKSQGNNFWMSSPMKTSTKQADPESRLYGGLM